MKNIIFLTLLSILISCSEESDPEPIGRQGVEPVIDLTVGTGCDDIVTENAHSKGVTISIKAELRGCIANVALYARTENAAGSTLSSYRKPSECNVTETTIAFSYKGDKVYLGLFPCGSAAPAGKAYTIHITQDGKTTTIESKVGNTIEYLTK